MSDEDGLICAYRFDGRGGMAELGWSELLASEDENYSWVHLQLGGTNVESWLRERSGLPAVAAEALLYEETRPRCTPVASGLLINLRGVNLNPGSDPEDMVSIRIYADENRVVTVRRRRLMAVQDIRDRLAAGSGPVNVAEFLMDLASQLLDRMGPVIAELDDAIDHLEDRVLSETQASLRGDLWRLRREAIALRRYVAPQRDALARLVTERVGWIEADQGQRLREVADRVTRYVEDLDAARERAAIIQDELTTRLSEQMNRNMYVLSVIAGIFLPLTVITGLLGINVAGIPGEKWPWAFSAVTAGLVVLGLVEYLLFKRLKWI